MNEGNEFEKPENEPAPVQRLVMLLSRLTFNHELLTAHLLSAHPTEQVFDRAPICLRIFSTEHIMNCAV